MSRRSQRTCGQTIKNEKYIYNAEFNKNIKHFEINRQKIIINNYKI